MAANIEPIKGLIELTDNFTSEIGLAEAALSNFTKANQESLKAVAGAAGIVAASIVAIGVATIELGKRGSDVNDVNETLVHFTGSTKLAQEAMASLRDGTKGTVDNFALASDAAHLLSAGVKLTTDDFGTLGQAAFVMQNRGLGPAKEQLDLVSDALVTGRTRALAMKLGVVDVTNAHEEYAKKLGVSVDKLSDAGKAEANRIAVMKILNSAVKDAGEQQRNFGEEIEMAGATVQNWIDDLASAVASSKVFKAGFEAVEKALGSAFGSDNQEAIQKIVKFIEDGAITVVHFGQVGIVAARIFEGAWEGVKTVILGVMTAVATVADTVINSLTQAAEEGNKLHFIPDSAVQTLKDTRTEIHGMTEDLKAQTVESAKAVVGHTEFDKTLDSLSDSLTSVEKAMGAAQKATKDTTEADDLAAANAKKLRDAEAALSQSMVDRAKIQKELEKSSNELAALDAQYFAEVAKLSGTTLDSQKADIDAWFTAQVATLDKLDPLYKQKYADLERIAHVKLDEISSDWASVKDKSLEGLQEQANAALHTYTQMLTSGKTFSREVLEEQLQKYKDLQNAVNTYGNTASKSVDNVKDHVVILDSAWDAVGVAVDENNVKVRTLHGEIISVKEALDRLNSGNQITYDLTTREGVAEFRKLNPGAYVGASDNDIMAMAKKGITLQQMIAEGLINLYAGLAQKYGGGQGSMPNLPGFADGGTVWVGERGPEAVRIPFGSQVYPTGTMPGGAGASSISMTFNVNGTAQQAAQQIKDLLVRELQMRKPF